MKHDEMLKVSAAMIAYGGGFVSALAVAWRHADEDNAARLEAAWPEYIEKYRMIAKDAGVVLG